MRSPRSQNDAFYLKFFKHGMNNPQKFLTDWEELACFDKYLIDAFLCYLAQFRI